MAKRAAVLTFVTIMSAALSISASASVHPKLHSGVNASSKQVRVAADPEQTLVDEMNAVGQQLVKPAIPEVDVTVPIAMVDSASGSECNGEISWWGDYDKARFSSAWHEYGRTKLSMGRCAGIAKATVTTEIADSGVPISNTHETSNSDTSIGPDFHIGSYASQYVGVYSFPWDIHSVGSRIDWSFAIHLIYKSGWTGPADLCANAHAFAPSNVVYNPITNC